MDGTTFAEQLRDDMETELSRLGSSKWLYALTDGEMVGPAVRAAADDSAETAARLFADWAESEDDPDAAALFEDVAADSEDHRDAIGSDEGLPDAHRPTYEVLSGQDATVERVAGLVGQSLVASQTVAQMVGFFVGDADPSSAETFRSIRADVDDHYDRAVALLGDVCETDDDWDRAETIARAVVEAAYDHYVETLESMGVKPKNVC
ncbi:MAG: transcription antitermination protein [Halobacterium sp.]